MDVRVLETYLKVVEAGSMAEAARRLDLAPTTVAQQVKALEADLGIRLLVRAGRTVRPTNAGMRIIPRSREIIRAARELRSEASDTSMPAGPLRLGATPTALMGLIPPALREWNRIYRDIEIYIEPGTTTALMAKVIAGDLDAAIMVHPLFGLPKTCNWLALREEKLMLITPATMHVSDPLDTIAREPFIRYDRAVVAGKLADEYLAQREIRPRVQFELDGIEHIAKFVAEGLGVSILPDWPADKARADGIRRWPLPEPCPSRTVGLLWLRSATRSPLALALTKLLKKAESTADAQPA